MKFLFLFIKSHNRNLEPLFRGSLGVSFYRATSQESWEPLDTLHLCLYLSHGDIEFVYLMLFL